MEYNELVEKMANEILGMEKEAGKKEDRAAAKAYDKKIWDESTAAGMDSRKSMVKRVGAHMGVGTALGAGLGALAAGKGARGAGAGVGGYAGLLGGSLTGGLHQGMRNTKALKKMYGGDMGAVQAAQNGVYIPTRKILGDAYMADKAKKAQKVAAYYEQAQLMKQAAEETYMEAQAMEDAANLAYNSITK